MTATSSNHFRKIQSFTPDYAVATITQYESSRTGLTVVVVDRPSSKVQGDFCLATEIHNDSGAPHTLEHLVFMGSRSYPYKGLLDKLANRAYSSTNAWTDTDHTNYTLETAGFDGFVDILPVYLEHLLLPTLKDSACYTEVHHVDGEGNDAGVVYSEMQALQNTAGEIMDSAVRRLLFGENIGYRYETGGMMAPLRNLTNDQIRAFHKRMYQPKNLRICIAGQVDHDKLLTILDRFEDQIASQLSVSSSPFKRPWIDSAQPVPLLESVVKTVHFPEEDESVGDIYVAMFGPDFKSASEVRALSIIIDYLSGSSAAILQNILVEQEELASSVDIFTQTRSRLVIWIVLSSVESSRLEEVEARLWQIFDKIADEPLDMQYLHDCARRLRKQIVYDCETDLGAFTTDFISDHLYGPRDGSLLHDCLSTLKAYDEVQNWSEPQWKAFMGQYLVKNKHVSIIGIPSQEMSNKLKLEEAHRLIERSQKIGNDGLLKLAHVLAQAKKENEPSIPDHVFENFPIPHPDSIPWMESTRAQAGPRSNAPVPRNDIQDSIDINIEDFPLSIHFEHMPVKCVYMSLILFADRVPHGLKPLLNIFMNNFYATPMDRDGQRIAFDEVIKDLERDTISYGIECGAFQHTECIRIRMVVEPQKYPLGIQWFSDLIFNCVFDVDRLRTIVNKLLADIPSSKRDGHDMAAAVDTMLHLDTRSTKRAQGTLVQALYLKHIKSLLRFSPEVVIADLQRLSEYVFQFPNMRALVSADVHDLSNPVNSWRRLVDKFCEHPPPLPVPDQLVFYTNRDRQPSPFAYVVPMSTVDSSFAYFTTHTIQGYSHARLPALLLALAYLDTTDGPLWNAVRGSGLAYGTNFVYAQHTGLLKLSIYRSPDVYKAFEAARRIVCYYVNGGLLIDKFTLEGAVSNIVLSFANEQTTIVSAGLLGFVNPIMHGIPRDYGQQLLRQVREVDAVDILAAIEELVLPIFNAQATNMVVTCAPSMAESVKQQFTKDHFAVEVRPLDSFQDNYGLDVNVGEMTDESEEEDDDDDELYDDINESGESYEPEDEAFEN